MKKHAVLEESTDAKHILEEVIRSAKDVSLFIKDDEVRQNRLKMDVAEYQDIKKVPYQSPGITELLRRKVDSITNRYFSFNLELLEADLANVVEQRSIAESSTKKVIQQINGRLGPLTKQRKDLLDSVKESCIGGVLPNQVKAFRRIVCSDPSEQAKQDRAFAEAMLRMFVKDWSDRVKQFSAPVTITGVGIHTLPNGRRELWSRALDDLGLRKTVGQKPIFMWIPYSEYGIVTSKTEVKRFAPPKDSNS